MSKSERSWLLLKSSLVVMHRNKKLLIFPAITASCAVLIVMFFMAPLIFQPTGYSYGRAEHWNAVLHSIFKPETIEKFNAPGHSDRQVGISAFRPRTVVFFVAIYLIGMFLATFSNVAFYHEILNGLNGVPVSIIGGLRFACTRWKPLFLWSMFAGLIGVLIRQLEGRLGFVGRFILRFIGMAWSIASVFAIPVIVREEREANPLNVLKDSAVMLKKTWGESLIGYVGFQTGGALILFFSLIFLVGAMIFPALAFPIFTEHYALIPVAVLIWIIALLAYFYLLSIANNIFRCALYVYASEGVIPEPYSRELMDAAWKIKKAK